MSRFGFWNAALLLSIIVTMKTIVVECVGQQIPGPHYPEAAGAIGDELVHSGTTPSFLSYHAVDQKGKEHVYVPVYVAVFTDAGESTYKDVRQNIDRSISIQGNGVFWCAFGHPYRQFAFQDKYKWQISTRDYKPPDTRTPAVPLIRSFLVESHVVKDIMLKSTTEPFNKIAGFHDFNVDQRATNQFGLFDESKSNIEAFALPGSLVTYVENMNQQELYDNKYSETLASWGKISDVASLKRQFNVPTEPSSTPETSAFVTVRKKGDVVLQLNIANSEDVVRKLNHQERTKWDAYLSALKMMEDVGKPADHSKVKMVDLTTNPIQYYPFDGMADIDTLIEAQTRNSHRQERLQNILDSFHLLTEATTNKKLSWENVISTTETKLKTNNKLRKLKSVFLKASVDFMSGKMNFDNLKTLRKEMENHHLPWKFCPSLDQLQKNLEIVSSFLKENQLLKDFPRGEYFSKSGLYEYYKSSFVSYIQSKECVLDKDTKNNIIRHINAITPAKRELFYSNNPKTDSKIFVGDKNHKKHILFPGDALSIEFVGRDMDITKIKSYISDVFDSTLSISSPKKVTFTFPDTNLDETSEIAWKKYAVEMGDYLKDSMTVQSIDLKFKDDKSLKYHMISHIMEGREKEMPVRLLNGHLIVDDRIAPVDVLRTVGESYNRIIGDDTGLKKLLLSRKSDILFVPVKKGLYLSNIHSSDISNSIKVEDYINKKFEKSTKNEIIVELLSPHATESVDDMTWNSKRSKAAEATDMLAAGYHQKNRNANVILASAGTDADHWEISVDKSAKIERYDDVRITLVGIGDTSSEDGVWKIGGHNSQEINDLVKQIKQKFNIKGHDLQKVSVVACNPESSTGNLKDSVQAAIKLANDVAKGNKVTVSTRVGFVKVDEKGHKWFSATNDGEYHRRQHGDVYVAVWDDKKGVSVISKTTVKADDILLDEGNKLSEHLGIKQTVAKEHESNILKGGYEISKELRKSVESGGFNLEHKHSQGLAYSVNSKVQKTLQKVVNYMSAYGMLQTATFLTNAEKCEKTEYTSKEACDARKKIAVISLTQEATEIVHDSSIWLKKKVKPSTFKSIKIQKFGTSAFKSFGKSVLRNPLKGLPVLGVGLDMTSLGLDIYDLTKAKTPTEKGIAGTSVALSSLSLIASGTALAAGILGATAVAAVAGPAALIVGFISFAFSIGVTIWQTEQYEKTQVPLVNEAAKYFESINSLYHGSWHNCKSSILYMKPGIAYKTISLKNEYIEVNSEYLCETSRRNWKGHTRIYPLLLGSVFSCSDYSSIESNCYCEQLGCPGMINVRDGMNIGGRKNLRCRKPKVVVITSAPIVLRGYSYAYFDQYDSVIGLHDKDPESKFQDIGHQLARKIDDNYPNFDYFYHFCWDKYAIINNINRNKYIRSITNIELGPDNVHLIVPHFDDPSLVTFSLTGIQGFVYTVNLSNSCRVSIKSDMHSSNSNNDLTLWKIIVGAELVDLKWHSKSESFSFSYESSNVEVNDMRKNQVIIIDKNNIISIPLRQNNKFMMYVAEVQADIFSSDQPFLNVMRRYFLTGTIDLSMTFIPIKNLPIRRCGNRKIAVSYITRKNNYPKLYYTSDSHYRCSDVFNTDSKIQMLENDKIHFSSSLHSLVWQSDLVNNSLLSFAKLPCHSNDGSIVSFSVVDDQIYIKQSIKIRNRYNGYTNVEAVYRLTLKRLFLLFITSDSGIAWSQLNEYCFGRRSLIFSDQDYLFIKTKEISAGENDLTFVNISNDMYWVKKTDGKVNKRIFPNFVARCESIEISFPNSSFEQINSYETSSKSDISNMNDEVYYFLCRNGIHNQMYVQSGDNRAKPINNLPHQNIYIKRNEILLQNETDTLTFDEDVPSKMCLFEYEFNLPYTSEESFNNMMDGISEKYECVESKTKLKFKQLVGWFDFEEMVTVIVHDSIASYDLKPIGTTRDLTKYWIWDTFNQTLYLQSIAEPSSLISLLVGNTTELEYQTIIAMPENVFVDAQEVEYESGRIYVYSSGGATYQIDEDGNRKILSVTDIWFARHPNAVEEIRKNTEKEVVIYRPHERLRFKRSVTMEHNDPSVASLIFHVPFEKIFDVDLSDSVYIGSNQDNMSIYTFNYHDQALLEFNEDGLVLQEDKYNIVHKIDQTLIIESNNATANSVPPFIDGAKTLILSSSDVGFEFNITEELWSKVDEILIHEDSAKLIIYLDMLLCDYDFETIDGRTILLDYAHRRKLVIPNADQRSKKGLVVLYVCGIPIILHYTKTYHIQIVISVASFLFLSTAVALYFARRASTKSTGFVPNTIELQAITQTVVQKEQVQVAEQRAALLVEFKGPFRRGRIEHRILASNKH